MQKCGALLRLATISSLGRQSADRHQPVETFTHAAPCCPWCFRVMRYTNRHFTYLLTMLWVRRSVNGRVCPSGHRATMMYAHIRETREQADMTEGAERSTAVKTDRCVTAPATLTPCNDAVQTAPDDSLTAAGKWMSPH